MSVAVPAIADAARLPEKGRVAILCELTKARLTLLVVLTTWVGYYLGSAGAMDWAGMLNAIGGTALLAAGASILNQYLERDLDRLMRRTEGRPLPSGQMDADLALALGVGLCVAGLFWLLFAVNRLTAGLGALTLVSYLFIYTPLKRVTVLNTLIGAVPGALPPLMGWAAATGNLDPSGWALFAVLFFWQLPHFMAIAWLYREDYRRAGFRMLSSLDTDGHQTAASAVRNTLALMAVSLLPFLLGNAGRGYLAGAVLMGALFLACAGVFARQLSTQAARRLFFASILYLPLLLGLLVADQRRGFATPAGAAGAQRPSHPVVAAVLSDPLKP